MYPRRPPPSAAAGPKPTRPVGGVPRPAGKVPFIAQVAIGFCYFFIVLATGFTATIVTQTFTAFVVVAVPGLIGSVLFMLLKCRWSGFLVGVLIALGLCLLLAGICAGMLGAVGYN